MKSLWFEGFWCDFARGVEVKNWRPNILEPLQPLWAAGWKEIASISHLPLGWCPQWVGRLLMAWAWMEWSKCISRNHFKKDLSNPTFLKMDRIRAFHTLLALFGATHHSVECWVLQEEKHQVFLLFIIAPTFELFLMLGNIQSWEPRTISNKFQN